MSDDQGGMRARGEEAVGDLAQALLENPVFSQALAKALGAGERAIQAQRTALNALDVPSASELERLNRRLRALSDRLEAIEDALDAIGGDVSAVRAELAAERSGAGEGAGAAAERT